MIGRVVITSVPQGLGGGSGFQPVLRTAGLRTSIAERLAMRAAYPHPYDFGDPRNPHVLFHRIESVGDRMIHILGSVRDAGSSYTGRSNSLAELLAIDPAETRALPAGPAFAARAFPWLSRWAAEPRETPLGEEPAIPADDPHDPEVSGQFQACTTWASVAGDAGWAGELARSFLDGRSAVIYVEPADDVAALFAEAARLLPLASRWSLTFNTCEIEPFPAHWRAWRAGIPICGPRPAAKDLVLDLSTLRKNGERAPDHDLTQRARGESPSQTPAEGSRPSDTQSGRTGTQSVRTDADDEALRAHLKQISDERKRRSMTRPTPPGGAPRWSLASILAAVALGVAVLVALCVTVIAVNVALDPGANYRWFGVRSGNSHAGSQVSELRSSAEQEERDTQQLEEKAREQERVTAQKRAQKLAADEQARTQKAAAVEQETNREREEQQNRERMAALAQQALEKQSREKKAIDQLEANNGMRVEPLRGDASSTDLDTDDAAAPPAVDLCTFEGCSFEDLIDPTIEIACPYEGKDRLQVQLETASLDQARSWTVTGAFFNPTAGSYEKPVAICRIRGQDKRLWLDPLVATSHRLFNRLENSVVLVASKDPGTNVEKIRRQIRLAQPIDVSKRKIILDPLGGHPPGEKVTVGLDQDIARRVEDIPTELIRWEFILKHAALPTKDEKLDDNDIEEITNPDGTVKRILKQTLNLGGPSEKGLVFVLSIPEDKDGDDAFRDRTFSVRLDAQVDFSPKRLLLTVNPLLESAPEEGKGLLNLEQLLRIRRSGGDLKRFENSFLNRWQERIEQLDPRLQALNAELASQQARLVNLRQPGADPVSSPNNPDYRKWYQEQSQKISEAIRSTESDCRDRRKKCEVKAKDNVSAIFAGNGDQSNRERLRSWSGMITVRITRCEAIARDPRGNEYVVPIVAPGGD
jgi:hypothetical protein